MPADVIAAVACHEQPECESAAGFSITSALYLADQLSTRISPPDSFAIPDWNNEYLENIGCQPEPGAWQSLVFAA
jgi:hypothetical protein